MANDVVEIVLINGAVRCVYINDYRVAGNKPYASEEQTVTRFEVPNGTIREHTKRKPRSKS